MLSMKSLYSPFALAFRSSHEQLNPYHRISGRIIYSLLILHLSFYVNFFVQAGLLKVRLTQLVPLLGVLAFTLLTILATTSLARVRRWSYRVFFVLHLTIAVSVLPILFFHAKPIRFYLAEALILFVLDITARKLDTFTGFSQIIQVTDTKLVKLIIPVPPSKIRRFQAAPGQHVYLSLPPESTPTTTSLPSIHDLMFNPFTVADVSSDKIMLVLRTLHGPTTTALQHLTKLAKAKPGINIEGPYGDSRRFPNFMAEFDKILLVAGGVGATFILPIFNHITSSMSGDEHNGSSVEMIWSVRSTAEAGWVTDTENPNILEDPRVKIYITGANSESSEPSAAYAGAEDGSIVMGDLRKEDQRGRINGAHIRPNLRSIVDTTFQEGAEQRVAVLVCGPAEMAKELREHVGGWVSRGRDVWWHDECFGW
jgi:ferredoxin-NADP reductase